MRPNEQLKWSMRDCRVGHEEPTEVAVMVVRLAGIEPTTLGFGGQYSIH